MPKSFTNKEISKLLKEISAAYEVKEGSYFKIAAYDRAASAVEHTTSEVKDLYDEGKLDEIPAVGKNIAAYLSELFEKGEVKHFREVKKGLPKAMFAILEIPGIGPKTAHKLVEKLKLKDVKGLRKFCQDHKVQRLEGFGVATEKKILRGIGELERQSDRMLLPQADQLAEDILALLRQNQAVLRADSLGSLRRKVSTIGDVDIAVSSNNPKSVINFFTKLPQVDYVTDSGEKKVAVVLKNGRRVDLMVQCPTRFGSLLQHFTGSKQHNIHLRRIAGKKGLSLSEYGIRKIDPEGHQFSEDLLMECAEEEEFYRRLGMYYIPPELREDTGEIEAAQKHNLPGLVDLKLIKGDLHVHSTYPIEPSHDLGVNTMKELVKKARSLRYQYLGLSDHSPAVTTHTDEEVRGLVKRRTAKIAYLKSSINYIEVLNCLEVDILANGKVSLPNDVLETLDLAIVGVHSSHRQSKALMTKRILGALGNPHVHILSHPTGRLLLEREGYEADWTKIFQFCARNHKALEINASPNRLDLPDFMVREAKRFGVKFIVNTDSHNLLQMENMGYGVSVARRGWCEKKDVINTWPLKKVLDYFRS